MGLFDKIGQKRNPDNFSAEDYSTLPEETLPEDHTLAAANQLAAAEQEYCRFCTNVVASAGIISLPSSSPHKQNFTFCSELKTPGVYEQDGFCLFVKATATENKDGQKQKFLEVKLKLARPEDKTEYVVRCDGFRSYVVLTPEYPECLQIIEVTSPVLMQGYVMSVTSFENNGFTSSFLSPEAGMEQEVEMPYFNEDKSVPIKDLILGFLPGVTHDEFLIKAKEDIREVAFTLQKLVIATTPQGNRYLSMQASQEQFTYPNKMSLSSSYGRALKGLRVLKK